MKFEVDGWNNFCRVFELPENYPSGYCFGDGLPTVFTMVDWFIPISGLPQPTVSKERWQKKIGEIDIKIVDQDAVVKDLLDFLRDKRYVKRMKTYLVICNFGMAFTFKNGSSTL